MVAEYKANGDAADSDDDKRIRRAEKRALQKRIERRGKKQATVHPSYAATNQFAGFPSLKPFRPFRAYGTPVVTPAYPPPFAPLASFAPNVNAFQSATGSRFDRSVCFSCGQQGHWKNSCPVLHTTTRQNFRPGVQALIPNSQPGEAILGAGIKQSQ